MYKVNKVLAEREGFYYQRYPGEKDGDARDEEIRTPDLYRVNFEVNKLRTPSCLAFSDLLLLRKRAKTA